jgi:polysaccharide biosynthesis transport protein
MAVEVQSTPRYLPDRGARRTVRRGRGEDVDWLGLLRTLWRRKLLLGSFVLAITGLAWLWVQSLTPIYEAEAQVMINDRAPRVVAIEEVMPGVAATEQGLAGQVMLVRSRNMAERVAERLNLHLLPEYNPALGAEPGGLWRWSWAFHLLPADWLDRLPALLGRLSLGLRAEPAPSDLDRARFVHEMIIDRVQASIVADSANRASVLALRFVSEDPELAALGANTVALLYLEDQRDARAEASRRAGMFLDEEIGRLRADVIQAEEQIQAYRRRTGLIEGGAPALDNQQLSQITTQLVLARGERAAAEARLGQVQRLLTQQGEIRDAAELLDFPAITELKSRELELTRRMAELSTEYGERHPLMVNLRAEFDELRERLQAEVGRIVQRLRNEVQVARSREGALQAHVDSLKSDVADHGRAEIELRALEREATSKRALLDTYSTRAAEIASQRQLQDADARVISHAVAPLQPTYPRKATLLSLALFGSLLLGSLMVFGLEQLDHTVRSGEQIEGVLGVPSLGLIPAVGGLGRTVSPESYVLEKPSSSLGEALRSLRASLLLTGAEPPPRTLLFTSSLPEEGKTATALALARIHARSGRKTVIVDADLRRGRLHLALGQGKGVGLAELLQGRADLDTVLRADPPSGASWISAGAVVSDPTELLSSDAMRRTLDDLAGRFELVVIDSPPVLSVADARIIAQAVERTVFLIRWGQTRRQEAMMGLKLLAEAGARLAGVALTRVDVRRHARYGYSDSGYYYNDRYVKYYDG